MGWCSAINCKNNTKDHPGLHLFRVPREKDRAKKWIQNSRRQDLLTKDKGPEYWSYNIKFCHLHFEEHMFSNPERSRLVFNAVPTLFNVPNPPPLDARRRKSPLERRSLPDPKLSRKILQTNEYIRGEKKRLAAVAKKKRLEKHKARNKSPQRKLRQIIKAKQDALRYLRRQRKKLSVKVTTQEKEEAVLDVVSPLLTKDEVVMLKERLRRGSSTTKKYSSQFKRLVIRLSFKSASAFKYLSKRLHLPSRSTVHRWISSISFVEGFDQDLFRLLEERVKSLPEKDRVVSIIMDEMALKEGMEYDRGRDMITGVRRAPSGNYVHPASALGIMVTGVRSKWKQVVGYHFAEKAVPAEQIHKILLDSIARLSKCGLHVVNWTSDQGSTFSSLVGRLGAHEKRPFFALAGRKVFVTPDPPHLLKSARNALLDHNIMTENGEASWRHLEALYQHDRKQQYRLAPKLTLEHIEPPPLYGRMSVSKASHILSNTVSCAIQTYVQAGALPAEALATAHYCSFFDRVFDCLNSSRRNGATSYKSALQQSNKEGLEFVEDAVCQLKTLQILDKDSNVINQRFRFLQGFALALSSVKALYEHLQQEFGFEFLLTRRLCQDSIENFFGVIRGRNGYNANPTCLEFSRSVKIILCD